MLRSMTPRDAKPRKQRAAPQEAAVLMGLITFGASAGTTGSWWRAGLVGGFVTALVYFRERWSQARNRVAKP